MTEIKLEKRYPHSRTEDITDAFVRGYQQGKEDEHRWWSNHCANCKDAEQTEPQKDCKKCKNYDRCKNNHWKCCVYQPKDEPQICDTCRYYNSNIPCGSTPSACKEADKFAEEFVDGLKKLKSKDEPQTYITEDRDTQILDAWQVHHRNTTSGKDEPQTERRE